MPPTYANGHISATGDPIHFMFGSRVRLSGTAHRMALFTVRTNPRWRPPQWWKNVKLRYLRNWSSDPLHVLFILDCCLKFQHTRPPISHKGLMKSYLKFYVDRLIVSKISHIFYFKFSMVFINYRPWRDGTLWSWSKIELKLSVIEKIISNWDYFLHAFRHMKFNIVGLYS